MMAKSTPATASMVSIMDEPDRLSAPPESHERCFACGPSAIAGMYLEFSLSPADEIICDYVFDKCFEGYAGIAHGGIVSTALDAAMTHWLFAHDTPGLTARLNLRYRHPVELFKVAHIRAWLKDASPPVYQLAAEIIQEDQVRATAEGTFMHKSSLLEPDKERHRG